jgi:hypothetical protein
VDEQNETSGDETPAVPAQTCFCHTAPSGKLIVVRELGMDQHYAEVSLLVCPDCRQSWLRYLYELEAISNSGRWYPCLNRFALELAHIQLVVEAAALK